MSDLYVKILIVAAGSVVLYFGARYWADINKFLNEVVAELKKVSWTSRKDLINASYIVIISAICLGCFITFTDLLISRGLAFLIR